MRLKRFVVFAIIVIIAAGSAEAGFDGLDGVRYVPIIGNGFAVDSLDGVAALYNEGDSYYQCSEYVRRYYAEVYSVEVEFSDGPVSKTEGYWFEACDDAPKAGDIAYIPAYNRGKSYGHWAVVKAYGGGMVTLIEQNWRWSGMAALERKIPWPSGTYIFYRLTDGESTSFPSAWALDGVTRAEALGIGCQDYRKPVTRLEFCSMLVGTMEAVSPELFSGDEVFLFDDTVSEYASKSAIAGLSAKTRLFCPEDEITRQEAAVMLSKALTLLGDNPPDETAAPSPVDGDTVSLWTRPAVSHMLELGFFVLDDGGLVRPFDSIEAQHALVLMMYIYDRAQQLPPASQTPTSAANLASDAAAEEYYLCSFGIFSN